MFKQTGVQAKFSELVMFVRNEADEANSLYGKIFYDFFKSAKSFAGAKKTATVLSTKVERKQLVNEEELCPFCGGSHRLLQCERFQHAKRYQRVRFLARNRRCFRCLEPGHMMDKCESQQGYTVAGCTNTRHHTLLHKHESDTVDSDKVLCAAMEENESALQSKRPYFMTVPVRVSSGGDEVSTYALLDTGSQRSFCDYDLARRMGADGPMRKIPMTTLSSGSKSDSIDRMEITVKISGYESDELIELSDVLTVAEIPLNATPVPSSDEMAQLHHLKGITLPELPNKKVGLLIGLDASFVFRALETRFGPRGTPDAIKTLLGWILFGPAPFTPLSALKADAYLNMHVAMQGNAADGLEPRDGFIESELQMPNSREDRAAYQKIKDSVRLLDGHFHLPLLWKRDDIKLLDARPMAKNRLESLKRRLMRDENLRNKYSEVMQACIEKGYAEVVCEDTPELSKREWFLPHHPVFNPHKPDKLRIVFDCAAKHMGVFLNDVLLQGPDLLHSLVGVLTRFRSESVALAADIESMFHQVKVNPEDRDSLKFIWWPNGDLSKDIEVHRMTVHLFGATSSPSCCSFCLKQVAVEFGCSSSSKAIEAIERGFYVDDCLVSVSTTQEAIDLISQMRSVLSKCGFNLTKWTSNKRQVIDSVPEEHQSRIVRLHSLEGDVSERVLGVHWDLAADEFRIQVNISEKPLTKRGILSMSHSIFDPLGFVAPVLIEPKLLFRELGNLDWDERISDEQADRWKLWVSSLQSLKGVGISRCVKPLDLGGNLKYEMHHFANASTAAYGVVSYLRVVDENMKIHCSFLFGKSHLTPARMVTIPRLELMPAVTATRLDQMLKKELPLPKNCETYFWSDSTAVLQSIYNSSRRFPVFVANRLAQIDRCSKARNWNYVPSALNPADDVSRGVTAKSFVRSSKWLSGPDFLWRVPNEWPKQLDKATELAAESQDYEERIESVHSLLAL